MRLIVISDGPAISLQFTICDLDSKGIIYVISVIVKVFLETNFEGGRHQRRLQRITEIQQNTKGRP